MPNATDYALNVLEGTATRGGAVNAAGLVSLQRAAEAGTAAATGGGLLSGGLGGLLSINPAGLLFSVALSKILGRGGEGLQETSMTPEETALYTGQERLGTTLGGVGEGAGELILDAIEQAKAAGVTPEEISATLNNANDPTAGLINLTVGSNDMFVADDATTAAAQAASQAAADAAAADAAAADAAAADAAAADAAAADAAAADSSILGGDSDLEGDTETIAATVTSDAAAANGDNGGGDDTIYNETWVYDQDTDSFISSRNRRFCS